MEADKPIVVIGFMGAGKNEVGLRVADQLGFDFWTADEIFQSRHGPIEKILDPKNEGPFRKLERVILRELLSRKRAVISAGGGALVNEFNGASNCEDAREKGIVIWLRVDFAIAEKRVKEDTKRTKRPMFNEDAKARFDFRQPLYENAAHITVDANRPIDDVVADVLQQLEGFWEF